jgi:hypothetical protein
MQSYKYFSHVSIMPTVTLNGVGRSDVCHYNVFYLCICGLLKLVIIKFSDGCLIRGWNCLPAFASTWVQPPSGFWWVLFSFLCCVLYVFALCSLVRWSVSPNFLRSVILVFRPKDRYRTVLNWFNIQSFIKLSKRSKILIFTSWLNSGLSRWVVGCMPGFC